jgi:Ca2+-binding RTX toxin-like protein
VVTVAGRNWSSAARFVAILTLISTAGIYLARPASATHVTCNGYLVNHSYLGDSSDNEIDGNDVGNAMHGMDGHDAITGFDGDDQICGGSSTDNFGRDTLLGDLGQDELFGQNGCDGIYGGGSADIVKGNSGNELPLAYFGCVGEIVPYNLFEGGLYGENSNDDLFGGDGDDYLDGGAGTANEGDGEAGTNRCKADTLQTASNCDIWV